MNFIARRAMLDEAVDLKQSKNGRTTLSQIQELENARCAQSVKLESRASKRKTPRAVQLAEIQTRIN